MALIRLSGGPAVVQIQGSVEWQVYQDPETHSFLGVCPALNLNALGDSWTEFLEAANESLDLLFHVLLEDGELEAFLRRRGWFHVTPIPQRRRVRFEMPFDIAQKNRFEELEPVLA